MDVLTAGNSLSQSLSSFLSDAQEFSNHQDIGSPVAGPLTALETDLVTQPTDRLELTSAGFVYTSTQEFSYSETGLVQRSDGTYFYREAQIEARQDIRIELNLSSSQMSNIDLDAVQDQLEEIMSDLQQGFRDSLRSLVESLGGETQTSSNSIETTIPTNAFENILSDDEQTLLEDYLVLLRQLGGKNSKIGKLTRQLEKFLGIGKELRQSGARLQSLQIEFEQVQVTQTSIQINMNGDEVVQEGEPLVLDLDGDGVELRSMENGVAFDIDNDGQTEQTGFVAGDDALLALDKNGNGRIDGVAELFGDQTGARNGFEDLSRYDSNSDGVINSQDEVFDRLRLFQDVNGDGKSSADELTTLDQQGITQLDLNPVANPMRVAGNRITETASFHRSDGSQGTIAEAYFRYRNV